jgi:hypothetical protein
MMTDDDMSPALRAALAHRARCQEIEDGRMFAWHDWRLSIYGAGCHSSPERIEQTKEFSTIVRGVLDGAGFWTGACPPRSHVGSGNGYPWHAARRRLRARCFHDMEVRFYVDPYDPSFDGAGPYGVPERTADFFSAALFRKVKALVSSTLTSAGFVDRSEHRLVGLDKVQFEQRTCGHWRDGGLSITNPGRDDVDALKMPITEGSIKAAYKHDGTLFIGSAHYGLNSMWRLVHGDEVTYVSSHDCFDPRPGLPHRFFCPRIRRNRVDCLLQSAVANEDFEWAAVLKRARDAPHGPTLVEILKNPSVVAGRRLKTLRLASPKGPWRPLEHQPRACPATGATYPDAFT